MNRKEPWEGYRRQAKRRLARCLLPAFLCAHIFIKRETSGYEADGGSTTFETGLSHITINMTTASGYRRISHDLVLIFSTWSCMSCHKLLQSHLLRHFHYLNQFRTYLVAVCPVSCCWPKSQSIFNPCNPLFFTTDDGKQYHCQNIVLLNNKTKGLAKIVRYNEVSLYRSIFPYILLLLG